VGSLVVACIIDSDIDSDNSTISVRKLMSLITFMLQHFKSTEFFEIWSPCPCLEIGSVRSTVLLHKTLRFAKNMTLYRWRIARTLHHCEWLY